MQRQIDEAVRDNTCRERGRKTIGLVFGGMGPEYEASLCSAYSVLSNLDTELFSAMQFGVAKDGSWLVGDDAWRNLYRQADPKLLPTTIKDLTIAPRFDDAVRFGSYPTPELVTDVDCFFLLMDGVGGEDGRLQGFLNVAGKPFTGSSLAASAQCYNKWTTKRVVSAAAIPVVEGICVHLYDDFTEIKRRVQLEIGGCDLIVKPSACGSSFGVSRVTTTNALDDALRKAFKYDSAALIERYIEGVELFVAVLGNRPDIVVAPPLMDFPHKKRHSTYFDKYIAEDTMLKRPDGLGVAIEQRATDMARAAYENLECDGLARVDLFYDPSEDVLIFNEINTIPAFSPDCAFAEGLAHLGYDYPDLLSYVINLAMTKANASVQSVIVP